MDIINYFTTSDKEYWLAKIGKCDWGAGKYLCELIRNDAFFDMAGQNSRLLLLVDGGELISFCTLYTTYRINSLDGFCIYIS